MRFADIGGAGLVQTLLNGNDPPLILPKLENRARDRRDLCRGGSRLGPGLALFNRADHGPLREDSRNRVKYSLPAPINL
jgi:hypothetical protein